MPKIQFVMSKNLFIRDPQETDLGRRIITQSIQLIDKLGIEDFTFRKLADFIESTEASIYRYFENKHRLLIYLISWYWSWLEYKIDYATQNIDEPIEKLRISIELTAGKMIKDPAFPHIDEEALSRIVIAEAGKTYRTKQVDKENSEGLFKGFTTLCLKMASFVSEVQPKFPYPLALISTLLEAAHQQFFFAEHIPSITELQKSDNHFHKKNIEFITQLVMSVLNGRSHV